MKTTIYTSMVALAFITSLARMFNLGDDKPTSGADSSIIAQGARLEKLSGDYKFAEEPAADAEGPQGGGRPQAGARGRCKEEALAER